MDDLDALAHHMGARGRPGPWTVATLAARQHGVVSSRQLAALGVQRGAIRRRVQSGQLHRLHVGVYAVGHPAITLRGRWMAAVLSCGAGALASHRTAAVAYELTDDAGAAIDVTAPGSSRRDRRGITVHRARTLHRDDRARRYGIPVTSVARTLLDLAETLPPRGLERAFEEAERLRLLQPRRLEELLARSRGRRGLRPLAALRAQDCEPPPATRSELERRFLALCREAGLPRPLVNVRVAGLEVDMYWPVQRLVVELDGHAYHRTRAAFERDRVRDGKLQVAGCRVLRLTHRRLEGDATGAVGTVQSMLALG